MALAQRTGRSRHRLVLLALTAITLLTVDLNGFGPAETAQRVVRDVMNPITSLTSTVFSPVGDAWNSVFNYGDLESENDALRAEIDALKGAEIQGEADSETLRRLLEASDLPYWGDLERVEAEVVRRSVGNFADHVVTINKGTNAGITEDMAVVTSAGLVGRVVEVDNSTATVRLLSDASLFVGLRLVSTAEVGLGHAVPGEAGMLLIDRGLAWPDSNDPTLLPEVGSAVVTSSESLLPAEIPVGVVTAVDRADDDVSLEVSVELSTDVENLHFVSVLLVAPPDQIEIPPPEIVSTTPTTPPATEESGE